MILMFFLSYIIELDLPDLKKLELVSDKFKIDFILPKTNDCIIEFELLEKDPDKKEYSPNSVKYKYIKNLSKQNLNKDQFIFDKIISLKNNNAEYEVKAKISKKCLYEMSEEIIFDKTYKLPLNLSSPNINSIPGIINFLKYSLFSIK